MDYRVYVQTSVHSRTWLIVNDEECLCLDIIKYFVFCKKTLGRSSVSLVLECGVEPFLSYSRSALFWSYYATIVESWPGAWTGPAVILHYCTGVTWTNNWMIWACVCASGQINVSGLDCILNRQIMFWVCLKGSVACGIFSRKFSEF